MLNSHCRQRRESSSRVLSAFCILSFALLVVFAGCSQSRTPADPGIITIAVRSGPNTLDPRLSNDEATQRISQLIYSPLLEHGDDLRIRPALAERFDNPDPLTYIAYLHRGVMFHDGHELTSRDVVYTFKSILDPALPSPFRGAFRALKDVAALDDYTVAFTLTEPFAAFPMQLTGVPPIVPADAGDSEDAPIGTGPIASSAMTPTTPSSSRRSSVIGKACPDNAGIVMKILLTTRCEASSSARAPPISSSTTCRPTSCISSKRAASSRSNDRRDSTSPTWESTCEIRSWLDIRVRHAIGYATNRDAIIEYLRRGLGRPAVGLVPDLAWAFEPTSFVSRSDPDRAGRLLDEAGYPDPDGSGPRFRLTLSLKISTNEETRLQATAIQHDLGAVGINLDVRS